MGRSSLFPEHPDDTRTEMLKATYTALQKHGYTALTIEDIDEEFPKSKSLIYQYYDSKDDLLTDFLAYMLEHFETETDDEASLDSSQRLTNLLDNTIGAVHDAEMEAFTRAMVALRGQAVYNAEFQTQFTEADRVFKSRIESIIRDGIESGEFDDVDPQSVTEFLLISINGFLLRRSTTDGDLNEAVVRAEIETYLNTRLGLNANRTDE